MSIYKLAIGIQVSESLSQDDEDLNEFSFVVRGSDINNFGTRAFHVNSKNFGSTKILWTADNRLDFKVVDLEVPASE